MKSEVKLKRIWLVDGDTYILFEDEEGECETIWPGDLLNLQTPPAQSAQGTVPTVRDKPEVKS